MRKERKESKPEEIRKGLEEERNAVTIKVWWWEEIEMDRERRERKNERRLK